MCVCVSCRRFQVVGVLGCGGGCGGATVWRAAVGVSLHVLHLCVYVWVAPDYNTPGICIPETRVAAMRRVRGAAVLVKLRVRLQVVVPVMVPVVVPVVGLVVVVGQRHGQTKLRQRWRRLRRTAPTYAAALLYTSPTSQHTTKFEQTEREYRIPVHE